MSGRHFVVISHPQPARPAKWLARNNVPPLANVFEHLF